MASGPACRAREVPPPAASPLKTQAQTLAVPGATTVATRTRHLGPTHHSCCGQCGRVGSGPWVEVGSGPTPLSGKGELVFAVNDDAYGDNEGYFEVAVSYTTTAVTRTCWPGWGYGDTNHEHCGPPGLANKPPPPGQASQPTHGHSDEHGNSQENAPGNSQENGNSKNK